MSFSPIAVRTCLRPAALIALMALAPAACVGADGAESREEDSGLVIVVDRTGVARQDSWGSEVGSQTRARVERALADGVDRIHVTGAGSNTAQTATAATVDVDAIDANTPARRREQERRLVNQVAMVASRLASQPVDTGGTDIVAALRQAADSCSSPDLASCSILLLSDMEDARVVRSTDPATAAGQLASQMPALTGVTVEVSGLGASGSDAATVSRVEETWTRLLTQAGAVDVRMARSL
jgi:hypothetical protein